MRRIIAEQRIVARDQNRVFVELGRVKPSSAQNIEARYLLKPGKGNAYVEFDVDEGEIGAKINPLNGEAEFFVTGDVDLVGRNAAGFENV